MAGGGTGGGQRHQRTLDLLRRQGNDAKLAEYVRLRGQHEHESKPAVLSCNWNTVAVFLLLTDQWERVGMAGVFHGVPADRIESTLRLSARALDSEEFMGLKLMIVTAKPALNDAIRTKK